jgi:hypothetical protein
MISFDSFFEKMSPVAFYPQNFYPNPDTVCIPVFKKMESSYKNYQYQLKLCDIFRRNGFRSVVEDNTMYEVTLEGSTFMFGFYPDYMVFGIKITNILDQIRDKKEQ